MWYFSCVYRFEAGRDERVKLTITKVVVAGGRVCHTTSSADTGRYRCTGNTSATLRIYEVPWADVPGVPRDCFCSSDASNISNSGTGPTPAPNQQPLMPFTYVSTSQVVELRFQVTHMNATDDYDSLYFEGFVKFVRMPLCAKNTRRMGPSGEILFQAPGKIDQVRIYL